MSFVEVLNMKLQRTDQSVSWGFNVQGGKEFNCPLMIQKITPASLAERCSIRAGDYILRIGSLSTEHLTHNQARDSIIRQGNVLELTLQRGAVPRPDDYAAKLDFPQHQLMTPEAVQQPASLSPQVGVQIGKNKALLTQSYNSPMGLYSSQNIADTLVTSMKNVNVNDTPQQQQQQPQHASYQPMKSPAGFTSTHTLHTSPNSVLNVKKTSYSISNLNNQFGTASNSGASLPPAQPVYPPYQQQHHQQQQQQYQHSQHYQQQHQQQQVRQQSFYPPNNKTATFSMPEMSPAPVRPAMPAMPQFAAPSQAKPAYSQPQYQPPSPAPFRPAGPAPGPSNKSKNLKNFIGANRGSHGSHVLNAAVTSNMPTCNSCHVVVRGPFISAIGKVFCPNHFVCAHPNCGVNLEHCNFVEEEGRLYCEKDFQNFFAPSCTKCKTVIMGECTNALEKSFHPECFVCHHCKTKLGHGTFHMEDGHPYCPKDFAALFAQKCAGCEFPIEAGDNFYEAINQLWHVECFTCQTCHVPLQASGFCVKGTKPYCKKHAF